VTAELHVREHGDGEPDFMAAVKYTVAMNA